MKKEYTYTTIENKEESLNIDYDKITGNMELEKEIIEKLEEIKLKVSFVEFNKLLFRIHKDIETHQVFSELKETYPIGDTNYEPKWKEWTFENMFAKMDELVKLKEKFNTKDEKIEDQFEELLGGAYTLLGLLISHKQNKKEFERAIKNEQNN